MSQEDIRKNIDILRRYAEGCDPNAVILSGTATGNNVSAFMLGTIDKDKFKNNASEIALIAVEYVEKCTCNKNI